MCKGGCKGNCGCNFTSTTKGQKGDNGNFTLTNVTYAQMQSILSVNKAIPSSFYKITDRGDVGIIVQATGSNTLSLYAEGIFLNPDFQDTGDYSGLAIPKGINHGVWTLNNQTITPFEDGDITFWDGIMYQVTDESLFTVDTPDINPAYTALTKSITNGYILECNIIEYNFASDAIILRKDKRGNEINNIAVFQWGNDNVGGNKSSGSGGGFYIINQRGIFGDNSTLNRDVNATNLHEGTIAECIFENSYAAVDLNSGIEIRDCIFRNISVILDPDNSYNSLVADHNYSDFVAELDMSDPAVFSGGTLTLPAFVSYHIGTYILMGNSGQTINKIVGLNNLDMGSGAANFSVLRVRFQVESGNTQSFQNVAVAGAVPDTLNAETVSTVAIIGRTNSSDYIEYSRSGTKNIMVGKFKAS